MSKFFVKHPVVAGYVFSLLILYWLALGNLSPLVMSRFNIAISTKWVLYTLIISMFFSNIIFYKSIPTKRQNTYELFLNSLLPVLFFYMLKLIDYNVIIVILTLLLITIASVLIYALQRYCRVRKIRIIYFVRHIIAFNIVILIIPSYLYYHYEKPTQEYISNIEFYEQKNVGYSEIDNEYETLKSELHNCNWDKISISEKSKYILCFIEYEAKELGISPPSLKVENLDTETYKGFYSHSTKTITLNSYNLLSKNIDECLITVAHEVYHAFQHSVIDIMGNLNKEVYEDNNYFAKAKIWIEADKSYATDKKTVLGYENNALEVDAREFADELVRKYGFKQE